MDETDDGYVPQISQIDYNLMDNGGGVNGSSNYYNSMGGHVPPPNVYAGAEMQRYQHAHMVPNQPMSHAYPGMAHGMMPNQMTQMSQPLQTVQQSAPQQPPVKSKRGGRKKNANNQQASAESSVPAQQPLPASYPSHMNQQMMQQQMKHPTANPYNYPMQPPQQKWPDYNCMQQQQYRPMSQQSYPAGYPMHPSAAQNYYAANQQQRPPPQYYQQYPSHYPGQTPQSRYPTPQPNQQYYMDPNVYNYPGHGAAPGYPQAQSSHSQPQQKPELMGQQAFQQQPQTSSQPYQQGKATSSGPMTSNIPQPNYSQQPSGSAQQQPNSQWPSLPYNGVPPNYYPQSQQAISTVQNLQREIVDLERQYQQCGYQQNKTPEIHMRMDQLYKKICYLKQQLQQFSVQQLPAQQSPPQTVAKGYPNYPSNGQIMDSSTANSTISPMSSGSSVHHGQSGDKTTVRPPTQDPNSSVSVMQPTPSQVQVNITPEAPGGRTLISVYHQYPSSEMMTNSTHASAPVTSSYSKDTVPPEPVPSSLSTEQQLYALNQHQTSRQVSLPSNPPSTSVVNTMSVTDESKFKHIPSTTSAIDYPSFTTQQTTEAETSSPIPPQPVPTTFYEDQRQASMENAGETSELSGGHTIQKIENVQSSEGGSNVVETQTPEESGLSRDEETFETELDDLKPPAAPRMISNYEEEMEKDETEETTTSIEKKYSVDESSGFETQRKNEGVLLNAESTPIETIAVVSVEKPVKISPPIIEPSTSTKNLEETIFQEENVSSASVTTMSDQTETAVENVSNIPKSQPKKPLPKGKAAKGRKSVGGQTRKRKKDKSEDEDDNTDNDFVPDLPKKRSKGKSTAVVNTAPIEEQQKLDEFVEKRRSERRTERKTYSEKMDIDEDLLEEIQSVTKVPSADEDSPSQPAQPEWIVERILGVRMVTKMLPREKDESPAKSGEANVGEQAAKDDTETINEEKKSPETPEKMEVEKPENGVKEEELEEVQVEEIYVKFKGKSYLHCEWKSVEELEEMDRRIVGKINRFKAKYGEAYLDDNDYFNEDYLIVDRVLDEHEDEEAGEHSAFIKWRSLAYEDCTWENIDVVPKSKLDEFHRRNDTLDPYKARERNRPNPDEWAKIPSTKMYREENSLRDYQTEGVNWLLYCYYHRHNCILADEMGLGKTIQTITFLQEIYDKGIHGPFLIVVPLSTLHNWEREFESWTTNEYGDIFNVVVYHGSATSRELIQNYEMYYDRPDCKKKPVYKFDAILTTYEMVVSDAEILRKFNYRVCVIDEAHRLKNRNSKLLTGGLLSFKMEHRVLLTGTPLQNTIQELFSLLNFLEPEQFCNSDSFLEQFGQCQTEEQVQKLQEILKPMMLRRLKEDVEKTLQPKEETIIEVRLTNTQKKYYRAILERNFSHLIKGTSVPSLMNTMMELRKTCNHPFLLKGAEDQIISEFKPLHPDKNEEDLALYSLIQASGKMVLIDKLLPKLHQGGHKVLIFSQMVRVLDLLEEFLVQRSYPYERIDGNVRGDQRQAAIDRFSKPDSDRFVFLLCTRAGGLGINLTAADTVIIYDSDWNPQNDLQAQARCHRIGQTKMVKVYRLITANTYERDMFDKASLKLGLDRAVLQSTSSRDSNQQLSRKEVEDLLKKGAYGAVMDDENEGNRFSEEDIDTILSRRTQTIRLEPGVKGSTFAKASFASSDNREDIDLLDPQFWSKWAKKANIDVDVAGQSELIMSEPRSRRKRFEENYKGLHEGENDSDASEDDGNEPGGSKGRNRAADPKSQRKKKRRDEDEDYINYNGPDELTFNKSEFFKVEKLLAAYGWGRWKLIKENSDLGLGEKDIEHIARTLLLHCIREYRGDEKSREFVWQLIIPKGAVLGKGYHSGWAASPEYNPPAFAVDSSFQRHVHRHANKLMQRIFHLFVLQAQILGSIDENTVQNKPYKEISLEAPVIGDPPLPSWDADCDKCFLIGIYKHGMENFEAIRNDPKLCFIEKKIEEMPTTIELNTRFKRIILTLSRKLEMALLAATNAQTASKLKRWPRNEENEFMRLIRIYGVKDDHEGLNVINWKRFRELSTNLQQKTDAELLEELYCVLAMCTKQQGGELSDIDRRRASLVDSIPAKQAERLMFRLHLMRKIHAIVTTGIQNVRTTLKLCSNKTMPTGWTENHDEQLLLVVDMHGLDNLTSKVSQQSVFDSIKDSIDEQTLLRRIMEICTTLETGRWNGKGSIDMLDDEGVQDDSGSQTPVRSLAAQQQLKRGRKKNSTSANPLASSSPATTSQLNTAAAQAMMEAALLPLLAAGSAGGSLQNQQQQLQQFQALMTMYALSSMLPMSGDASSTSAANKQAMAALAMMTGNEDALNLSNPKKTTTTASTSSSGNTAKSTLASTSKSSMDLAGQFNVAELLALFNIPEETNIPVINTDNGTRLTGDKAPKLKNLDQWLGAHPRYKVDTSVMGKGSTPSTSTTKEATPSKAEKTETNASNGILKTLEPAESSSKPTTSTTSSSETKKTPTASDINSIKIGVFYKSTGTVLPQEKWPSITNLENWLTKNPTTQVQADFAPFAKELLPKSMHDRIGGEPTQSSSSSNTTLQQAATSTANLNSAAMSNLEALQIQLYIHQKMMESLNSSAYQNPYSALLGGGTSSAAASLAPSISLGSGLDANSAALLALFGVHTPASNLTSQSSSQTTSKNSTTSSLNNVNALNSAVSSNATSSSLMNEAALAAEILANPSSLALLLNSGGSNLTNNNNAASLNNSLSSSFPFGMDFNTALQLNAMAASGSAGLGSLSQSSSNISSSAVASLLSSIQAATSTPTTASKKSTAQPSTNSAGRASKLNAVVEKLSSSNANNNSS